MTTAVAFVDLGPFSVVAALGIAVLQDAAGGALLHAPAAQHRLTKLVVAGGLVWLGIMLVFTLTDFVTRGSLGVPEVTVGLLILLGSRCRRNLLHLLQLILYRGRVGRLRRQLQICLERSAAPVKSCRCARMIPRRCEVFGY